MQRILDERPRKDRVILMGDFNAQIGEGILHNARARFGYGINARGEFLLEWIEDNKLVTANTCFRHREGQQYTWVAPDGETKTQIDFIAIRARQDRMPR